MTQPVLLQAFANTPVQVAAPRQASGAVPCATCGQAGCNCAAAAKQATAAQPVDELELSPEAIAAAEQNGAPPPPPPPPPPTETAEADLTDVTSTTESDAAQTDEEQDRQVRGEKPSESAEAAETDTDLTEEEQQQVAELKSRDQEVRAHEQAHIAAAGPYATGGPSYSFQKGPDGQRYAVGGEVGIDTSPVSGDPEATIQKAQQIRAAALAPASPSSQDQQVAAAATQMESQARAELSKQNLSKSSAASSYEEAEEEDLSGMLLDLVA